MHFKTSVRQNELLLNINTSIMLRFKQGECGSRYVSYKNGI